MTKKLLAGAVAAAVAGLAPMTAGAVNLKDVIAGKTDLSVGGYVKATAMWSDYSHNDTASGNGNRQFYIPRGISTDDSSEESNSDFDFHARESRINFKTVTKMGEHTLTSYIEMDFLLHDDGNEVVSNSYSPRLRHAFLKYDNWLFGQYWSNYMDLGSLPESVDFLGPSDSVVFNRQAQIRYTNGGLSVSLENPETWNGSGLDRDDNELPDLIVSYTHKADFGHLTLAAVTSQNETEAGSSSTSDRGYGISLSGKIKVGAKDDIRFQVSKQDGVGRYTGLGLVNNVDANGDTIENTAGYVAYRHFWTDNLRSSVIYSVNDIDDDDLNAGETHGNEKGESLQLNLMYSPVKSLTFGIMYLEAERERFNGDNGEMERVQAIAKYAF